MKAKLLGSIVGLSLLSSASWGAEVADYVKVCRAELDHSEQLCECTGKKAKAELSPGGFDLLIAMLAGDDATSERLRGELPVPDVMKASMFMTRGPAACAKELGTK